MVVLDHLSQSFEPGRPYPEAEVNEILIRPSTLTTPRSGATWSRTAS